jgi:predicted phage-related endonuclease
MKRIAIQSDEQWLEIKSKVLSSTEVAALFGVKPVRHTPFELHYVKQGRVNPLDLAEVERVEMGKFLEPGIKAAIRDRMPEWDFEDWSTWGGRTKFFALHDRIGRFGSSLDAIATHKQTGEKRIVEVKNVDYLVFRDEWLGMGEGDDGAPTKTVEPPMHIHLQGQAQSAVTGIPAIQYVPLVGGNTLWCGTVGSQCRDIIVAREPLIIGEIERRVVKFWEDVDAGKEPDIDGYEATGRAIRELYPLAGEYEKPVNLDGDVELATVCFERDQLGELIKRYELQRDALTNRIKMKLGDVNKAECNGWKLSFGNVKGGTYTMTRKPGRQLRVTLPKDQREAAAAAE